MAIWVLAHPAGLELVRPLQVLVIVDHLQVAGAQRVIGSEAKSLDPSRVRLQVLALGAWPGETLAGELKSSGIPVGYVPGRGLRDPRRLAWLRRTIRRLRPDIVHTHLEYANILGLPAARLAGVPAVATLHNVLTAQDRLSGPKLLLERLALRIGARRVIVVARAAMRETQQTFRVPARRLVVLPNGIDLDRLRLPAGFDRDRKRRELGAGPGDRLVFTPARLEPAKGHRVLLEAAAQSRLSRPVTRYLFAGAGSEEDRLRSAVGELGLEDRVQFLGVRRDVPEILAAVDLFVLPSLNEGLPISLLEAMAVGVPVVVTDVGGAPDLVSPGETGWLVPPGNAAALRRAVDEAVDDPARASAYAARARRRVEEAFTVERHAERLESIYRAVLVG